MLGGAVKLMFLRYWIEGLLAFTNPLHSRLS